MNDEKECFVCAEPYNKSYRSKITCSQYNDSKQKCNFSACKQCIRRYILTSGSTAHCMSCKKAFNRNFMIEHLCRSWVDNEYETYVIGLLLNTEKARCPENMKEASNYKKIPILRTEISSLRTKRKELYNMILNVDNQILYNRNLIYQYRRFQLTPYEKKEKRKFIRKCPIQDCKGYLSQKWKCELCKVTICKDCMESVSDKKTHVCDENKKKTMTLLNKDTKPCPKCGEMIMKIDGCDQMWCPQCKNAWSWRKGTIVHGIIHNPHYYEYQRQVNNGNIPRVLGDIPCGGLPDQYRFSQLLRLNGVHLDYNTQYNILRNIHRNIHHFQMVIINPMNHQLTELKDNKSLRVKYIVGEYDDKKCKNILTSNYNLINKLNSVLHIYQLYNTIVSETIISLFNSFLQNPKKKQIIWIIKKALTKIENVRLYVNKELYKISFLFKKAIKIITPDFDLKGITISSKNQLKHMLK